jgi:hypothetical protein
VFAGVLIIAALVRLAAEVTYAPALMWADSWQYLFATDLHGGFTPDKPNGYALFLRLMGVGAHLPAVTAIQHLLGLGGGVLLYMLLRRLGCGRLLATLQTAIVLLDAYAIALEQHVLAEALFTFIVVCWAFVAVALRPTAWSAAIGGVLLVAAISVRAAGIFLVPIWLVYALWTYRGLWPRAVAVCAVVAAFAGYAIWHDSAAGGFGLNQMAGWQLYGRVAAIADCPGRSVAPADRPLCPPTSDHPDGWPDPYAYSLFSPASPLQRALGDLYALPTAQRRRADARLRAFSRDAILDRPLPFVGLVARDTAKYFVPGAMSPLRSFDDAITFPERPRAIGGGALAQRTFAPTYKAPPSEPADVLPAYQRWVHTPRWLLGLLLVVSIAALAAPLVAHGRVRVEHAAQIFLLTGGGFALVLGSALNHFEPRFLIPAVPLLVAGGTVALRDLVAAVERQRVPGP